MNPKRLIIFTDGASQGNPGQSAIGAVIENEQGKVISRISRRIGHATNNQAEYTAIIAALEEASRLGAEEVEVRADSELVVKQLNGRYKVKKATLRPLYQKVVQLTGSLSAFTITHIHRTQNRAADRLANRALAFKRGVK